MPTVPFHRKRFLVNALVSRIRGDFVSVLVLSVDGGYGQGRVWGEKREECGEDLRKGAGVSFLGGDVGVFVQLPDSVILSLERARRHVKQYQKNNTDHSFFFPFCSLYLGMFRLRAQWTRTRPWATGPCLARKGEKNSATVPGEHNSPGPARAFRAVFAPVVLAIKIFNTCIFFLKPGRRKTHRL
ncbi:hypothetical protein PoB_002405600 [Plakobranchus ocellatus]|uniref:Uncharacterized protein n=1 Tax=Plakobranchus ocellatus TaxID=259542 RepID=A0AAV3ZE79_9GAST|nr:hypothetical protein PoB_002405600 [Plakobranchus ocellatus]